MSSIPEQSFSIISPRIVLKTAWVTHEEVTFQYSRYSYNSRTCPGANPATNPTGFVAGANGQLCAQPPVGPFLPTGFGAGTPSNDTTVRGAPTSTPDVNVFKLQATMWW